MLENVLVFGGLINPAEGLFRNLVFSSPHGELSHFYLVPTANKKITNHHCRKYQFQVRDVEIFLHQN